MPKTLAIKELRNAIVKEIFSEELDENQRLISKIDVGHNNKKFTIALKDIWSKAYVYLWEGANINLYYVKIDDNNILFLDNEGYLILEPNILVSPTDIGNVDNCIRKYYLGKRAGKTSLNYELLRGTLINNAFDLLVEEKIEDTNQIIEKVLQEKIIDIASLNEEENKNFLTLKNELIENLNSLKLWTTHEKFKSAIEKNTEPSFISNKYGLIGRIDLLVNNEENYVTYELKTTKAPDNSPWQSHKQQVASYQLLLESALSCKNPNSYIIYSRGNANQLLQECNVDSLFRRRIINIRNQIVSIDYALTKDYKSEIYKKIIPKAGIGNETCQKCFKRQECFEIASLLNEEFENNYSYSSNTLDSETLEYYHKYFRMIELERLESRNSFVQIFNDNKEELVNSGKLIENLNFVSIKEKELHLKSDSILESEIKVGDIVIVYSGDINKCEVVKAGVKNIDRFDIYLDLKKEYQENFFKNKKWNVFTDFMETTYNVMNSALYRLITGNDKLKNIILGKLFPTFNKKTNNLKLNSSLNNTQQEAIKRALSCNNYFLIQGPPGTGKTHTLSFLIQELIKNGEKILLSAFTHKSIDNVLLKLIEHGFNNFIRIGNHESVDKKIHPYLVQEIFKDKKYHDLNEIKKEILNYPLVACTSISAISSAIVNNIKFSFAIVDEAGQLNEPSTIAILLNAEKFILVGDHKQLPPLVQNKEAKNQGFDKSLFERLIILNKNNPEALITLEEQYRMNCNIVKFPNEYFYDNILKTPEKVANQRIDIEESNNIVLRPDKNVIFFNIDKQLNGRSSNKNNYYEAEIVNNLVKMFIDKNIKYYQIGIISPFRAQVAEIKRKIISTFDYNILDELTIDTVDRFQGNDRDIIIFSSVISDISHITEFFKDERRLNVTITRAKKKFIMTGNYNVLSKLDVFSNFFKHCEILNK
jgi:DNA replication ATP-dependent helicase Dna2